MLTNLRLCRGIESPKVGFADSPLEGWREPGFEPRSPATALAVYRGHRGWPKFRNKHWFPSWYSKSTRAEPLPKPSRCRTFLLRRPSAISAPEVERNLLATFSNVGTLTRK